MSSIDELRKQNQQKENKKRNEYYNEEKDKENELSKLQKDNEYDLLKKNIYYKSKEDELSQKNEERNELNRIEKEHQLDSKKINNQYEEELKKLKMKKEKDELQKNIEIKIAELEKLTQDLETKKKINEMAHQNEENLKDKEIKHMKNIAEEDLNSLKTILKSKEDFTKKKIELNLERIKQNNKFEEDEKKIVNNGEIKIHNIELEKKLKLMKQEKEMESKGMILDFVNQLLQAKQSLNNQNNQN